MSILHHTLSICLLAAFTTVSSAQESTINDSPFPPSTALAEGISPKSLANLDQLIKDLVEEQEIVGGELLVIKNGRTVLHEAYGWQNREAELEMETGSVFCVRSMTKPLIGASIMMLVEEKKLKLRDKLSAHMPIFDNEHTADITIEQLLTHTSGMPLSRIMSSNPRELESIQAVAELGASQPLEFTPGTAFNYSDQGTDTLTALIEVVSGMTAAEFVTTRLLEPLGMEDTLCLFPEEHPLRERACVKYAGSPGNWTRFWGPDEERLFSIFLGSQGLYSTLEDYALFTDMLRRKGRAGEERLLKPSSLRKVLAPGPYPMNGPTGFPGMRTEYGFLMQLWTGEDESKQGRREVVAYGHTGSDGTHAWVFPKENAMVLYFTQSRGTLSGLRVEELLGDLFLGVPFDPNQEAPPFEQYLGYYWEHADDKYRAIIRDGEDLALEIGGKAIVPLTYIGEDRWKFRPNPSIVLEFDRDEEGQVSGYHIGDHEEFKFTPAADLPLAQELSELVTEAHRIDLVQTLGPIRYQSKLTIAKQGIEGEVISILAWPNLFRMDSAAAGQKEWMAFDGETVRAGSSMSPTSEMTGARAEVQKLDSHFYRFANWLTWCPQAQVIQVLKRGGRSVALVRLGDTSAPAKTLIIDLGTNLVMGEDKITFVEMVGRLGQMVRFEDYRDVSGMQLPFKIGMEYANPMIGLIEMTVTDYELGVDLPEGTFELAPDPQDS